MALIILIYNTFIHTVLQTHMQLIGFLQTYLSTVNQVPLGPLRLYGPNYPVGSAVPSTTVPKASLHFHLLVPVILKARVRQKSNPRVWNSPTAGTLKTKLTTKSLFLHSILIWIKFSTSLDMLQWNEKHFTRVIFKMTTPPYLA